MCTFTYMYNYILKYIEIESLQNTFAKIGYPRNFVLNISKNFIDKIFSDKLKIYGPEQKYLFVKLPYI